VSASMHDKLLEFEHAMHPFVSQAASSTMRPDLREDFHRFSHSRE
jgi:hypothetical protein